MSYIVVIKTIAIRHWQKENICRADSINSSVQTPQQYSAPEDQVDQAIPLRVDQPRYSTAQYAHSWCIPARASKTLAGCSIHHLFHLDAILQQLMQLFLIDAIDYHLQPVTGKSILYLRHLVLAQGGLVDAQWSTCLQAVRPEHADQFRFGNQPGENCLKAMKITLRGNERLPHKQHHQITIIW